MPLGNLAGMLFWLSELIMASFLLTYGVEQMSARFGGKFVGRTVMSLATTLPEIAIVAYAAAEGSFGVAIGSGLGSNLLMMTLGLSLMLLFATTKVSRAPLKGVDVSKFTLDKVFLVITAVLSAVLFVDGYNYLDGFVFAALFGLYLFLAFRDMKAERKQSPVSPLRPDAQRPAHVPRAPAALTSKAVFGFIAGTLGIFIGAGPFISSMQGFAADSGVSAVILAVVVSPIAGEMPEKVSMMILARKGEAGASIAVANVLGSKIFNNTLLLAVAVFGAMAYGGFYYRIAVTPILGYQVILATSITVLAVLPMVRKEIGLRTGAFLLSMYVSSVLIQLPLVQVG